MVRLYEELQSCRPSISNDAYILKILTAAGNGISAITSSDELLLVDATTLASTTVLRMQSPGRGLTCLASDESGQQVFCGGAEGVVSVFDVRSQQRTGKLQINKPVTALAYCGHDLATGTEQQHQQADVSVWDIRQHQVRWQNTENNDDITALNFNTAKPQILLSGGDDGLVSLFDTTIQEEDDSLIQAFNHGPIHKAGFVDQRAVYALSSDQHLAIHPVFDEGREKEPQPVQLGDVRPLVPCEYVIDLLHVGDEFVLAAGSHSKSQVDLLNMKGGVEPDLDSRIVLHGAHGEEIVRSLFVDTASDTIFTAGEDGCIKAFGLAETRTATGDAGVPTSKAKRVTNVRFKPY